MVDLTNIENLLTQPMAAMSYAEGFLTGLAGRLQDRDMADDCYRAAAVMQRAIAAMEADNG